MFNKIGDFFKNIKVVSSVLVTLIISVAFVGNAYTDYKLKEYVTLTALDTYMVKRDIEELLRKIEFLKLDLRSANVKERRMINDKISLINTQIRRIKGYNIN